MLQFFRKPALSLARINEIQAEAAARLTQKIGLIATEWCFYVDTAAPLTDNEIAMLRWLLAETFEPAQFSEKSFLDQCLTVLEAGPRLNFETAWSSTAVSICSACGLDKVRRLERSLRFGLSCSLTSEQRNIFLAPLYDRMTQMLYPQPLKDFNSGLKPKPVRIILLIEEGINALRAVNNELGLAMDEQDLQACYDLFVCELKRNPTDVEIFQIGQVGSEHCRHHFFKGRLVIDGECVDKTLMQIVQEPWRVNSGNSLIAFCDDSSAIRGYQVVTIVPIYPGECSAFSLETRVYHPSLTAETHNFPSGVAPFPGAETGTGGRIRDNEAVGRGGLVIASGAAYCVDNLHIPGYVLPWEQDGWVHPSNLAPPLDILIQASNGASDYGNKFGEPVIYGFTRTCGLSLPDGRRGWYKPIMYTAGAGQMDDRHIKKGMPQKGMLVVQVGGPAYRIGLGGGAASSLLQGDNVAELDFNAVQRGNAQMEQRMNRFVRACVELGEGNPIISLHDLGAGGDCNALPEIVDPAGAIIQLRAIPLGDQSLSVLEYWGNESQERNAFLIWPDRFEKVKTICEREEVPYAIVGEITGDGWLVLHDENDDSDPVQLPLDKVLSALPQKTFALQRIARPRPPLILPDNLRVTEVLERVLRLPAVGSKRFLTTKVDRSVTGLVAQQQCVGPNGLTLCDFAVIAQSHFGFTGVALSLGEQPMKGLISPEAMARLAVAEALLNMVGAKITARQDIKCSANWMLAAKLAGEGAWLYDAACALRDICIALGIAIHGGKDSLSMAAKTQAPDGTSQIVRAPGELVIACHAPMDDITRKVTPDLKQPGSALLFIDLGGGRDRLGSSALAQVYGQVGEECPDVEDVGLFARAFDVIQELVKKRLISAVHDRSDGGLIVALLEMAFAGNVGFNINLRTTNGIIESFFSEELGLVIECQDPSAVAAVLKAQGIPFQNVGNVTADTRIIIRHNGEVVLQKEMQYLRRVWEETSTQIDKLQANPACVAEEAKVNSDLITSPPYYLNFIPKPTPEKILSASDKPKVAILRTEGSNGDREMTSAFYLAGFEPWDVTMSDLISGRASLNNFQGIAFVGGFAFADVFDAGKGWAGMIRFNKELARQFQDFYERPDTFSLGVCNGCQLMALLGWVPWSGLSDEQQPRFIRNRSERFESRFSAVRIFESPAIMLRGIENSVLGIWVAHGEGRFHAPQEEILSEILRLNLAPLRFVDHLGNPTDIYPFNPNGSIEGITALCSPDGRHLAMMPHPERAFLKWQLPWMPARWAELKASPWIKFFQNAYAWCRQL